MNKRNKLLLSALLLSGTVLTSHAADLTVRVEGTASGNVYLALYNNAETWTSKTGQVRTDSGTYQNGYTAIFKDLPVGSYAIGVFIDTNENAKLDANPMGMPLEPYGVSRDARGHFGPPAYGDAAIELAENTVTTINLR